MENISYIYGLVSTENYKNIRYIGKTVNPISRLHGHLKEARGKDKFIHNPYKCRWINKELLKGNKIKIVIIDTVWNEDSDFWEIFYIKKYKNLGYKLTNLSPGGELSHNMQETLVLNLNSEVIKRFKSVGEAARYYNIPINNVRDNIYGRRNYVKGKVFIKAADYDVNKSYNINRKRKRRQIYQFDLNGNFIKEWQSIFEIAENTDFNINTIRQVLCDRQNSSRNYIWSYSAEKPKSVIHKELVIINVYKDNNYIDNGIISDIVKKYNIKKSRIYDVLAGIRKSTRGYTFLRKSAGGSI